MGSKIEMEMKKKENSRGTIGVNDEWFENIFDRKIILPDNEKSSELLKEFAEEYSTGKE